MANNSIPERLFKLLPPMLQEITAPYEGRNKDIVLLSSITVLSNCFPKVIGYYDNGIVYPQLFTMIVAPPASGKGNMMKAKKLIDPIHKYEQNKQAEMIAELFNGYVGDEEFMNVPLPEIEENEESENKHEKKKKKESPIITIIPANSSGAEFIRHMSKNKNGVIMIESEMDTMGNVLSKDWGDYSELLRQSFHHEQISVSRQRDDLFVEIDEPKLAVLMSGTPNQLKGVLRSKENGLFSRFLMYSFDEISDFKDVFDNTKTSELFEKKGLEILKLYKCLDNLKVPVEFTLSEYQQKQFLEFFRCHQDNIISREPLDFIANMRRMALIVFRICMVLTITRLGTETASKQIIKCSNKDFLVALRLISVLMDHSLLNYKAFEENGMSILDAELLDAISSLEHFSRAEFIDLGLKIGLAERTLGKRLSEWSSRNLIKRLKHGRYTAQKRK